MDEQIFAVQRYGGISRLFYEKANAYTTGSSLGVSLESLNAPIVNEYVLNDPHLSQHLGVTRAAGPYAALSHYFRRRRRRNHVDVVHNTFYLPRGLSDHPGARRVVTVYDMIPELLPRTRRRLDFLTRKHAYLREASHIVCISESTKRDLLTVYPDIHAPVTIAYPGVRGEFRPEAPRVAQFPEPYLLHVGNRGGYKDGVTLLQAFSSIAHTFREHTLLLVGGGPLTREEAALLDEKGLGPRIQQVTLPDSLIPAVYAQAEVTVFPSRYEGFGLPAVEAMAAGSPLVLADTSSLPEVGGDAALYFSPGNVGALASLLKELLRDSSLRGSLRQRGLTQAAKFTWAGYAAANIAAYRAVMG